MAIRVPVRLAKTLGLSAGDEVEIEVKDGDIVIHRPAALNRADAIKAAEDILKNAKGHSLGGSSIKELINEGRR
ncbi:MAG: AbrB/MazE/SpoVT family DNA-binding domain-containing protein [Rhodospirillaceae bacterium]|nr:AbrB/MazE/SpoVT family DNA-binding domain-containing protein [Rhodospirillaceae bacterium]